MENTKKILMISSLSCLAVSCLMLILAVFGVQVFDGILLRILLIVSTFAIACGLAIGELSVIQKNKILGYVSIGLLGVSVLFALIIFCSSILQNGGVFVKITGTFSLLSILFIIIISNYIKLGKSMLGLQIPTYIVLILLDLFLILLVCGVSMFEIKGMLETFIILIILNVGLLIATSVIASKKRNSQDTPKVKDENNIEELKIQIEVLKNENEQLRKENEELKAKLK